MQSDSFFNRNELTAFTIAKKWARNDLISVLPTDVTSHVTNAIAIQGHVMDLLEMGVARNGLNALLTSLMP
jgi:hypothetical protein